MKLRTKKGWLTAYGFSCGYHEKAVIPPFVVTLERWPNQRGGVWLVKVIDERIPWHEVAVVRSDKLKHARWGFTRLKREYLIESALVALSLEQGSSTFKGTGTVVEDGILPSSV